MDIEYDDYDDEDYEDDAIWITDTGPLAWKGKNCTGTGYKVTDAGRTVGTYATWDEAVNAHRGENLWYGNNHPNTLPVQIAKNGAKPEWSDDASL